MRKKNRSQSGSSGAGSGPVVGSDIGKIVEEVVGRTVVELKMAGLVKDGQDFRNTYRKTEQLLYAYPSIEKAIQERRRQIKDVREHGLGEKSKSIVLMPVGGSGEKQDREEKVEEFITGLEKSIAVSARYLALVDHALEMVKDDPYYEIIGHKYFDGWTMEEIAEKFGCDVSTVSRNKNRLVSALKIYLFTEDALIGLFA